VKAGAVVTTTTTATDPPAAEGAGPLRSLREDVLKVRLGQDDQMVETLAGQTRQVESSTILIDQSGNQVLTILKVAAEALRHPPAVGPLHDNAL